MILYSHQVQQEPRIPQNRYGKDHLALYLAYIYCLVLHRVVVALCYNIITIYFYQTMNNCKPIQTIVDYDVSDFQVVRPYYKKQVATREAVSRWHASEFRFVYVNTFVKTTALSPPAVKMVCVVHGVGNNRYNR